MHNSKIRKNLIIFLFIFSLVPFILLLFDNKTIPELWYRIANVAGFIGTVFLLWQFILGVRGFSKWITYDYDWVIKVHTFLGINGALFIIIHPILESMVYEKDIRFLYELNFTSPFETYLSYGKLAFLLFLFVWLSSGLFRKILSYRLWLYTHYLSYLILFFVLLHPLKIGTIIQSNLLIYYYWIFICFLSFFVILFKLFDIFNFTNYRYVISNITNYPGNIFTISYRPLNSKFKKIVPGQYFYIKKSFISESHPFSIMEYSEDTGELVFGIKKLGKYSEILSNSKIGDIHYLDGPFGEFTLEGQNFSPKVILAGGIGITPFYELVSQFGNQDTFLFYANKKIESALYRDNFKKLLGKNYFDFVTDKEGSKDNVFCEIITSKKIIELLGSENIHKFKFFICGSPGFTNSMIVCLKDLGIERSAIYIEEFEY